MNLRSLTACLFVAVLGVSVAKADTITISVTPITGSGGLTLTFDPATDAFNNQNGIETSFYATGTDNSGDFSTTFAFYNPAFFLGYGLAPWDFAYGDRDANEFLYSGAAMYSGTEANPVILPGTYNVIAQSGQSNATINISAGPAVAVTPEPSSLLLLATGMAGGILMLRRRLTL